MRTRPTVENTTEDIIDELQDDGIEPAGERIDKTVALPECERLAGSKVDGSDYLGHSDAHMKITEILYFIEDALRSGDEERLEYIANFTDPIQGFSTSPRTKSDKGDRIRWERSRVERAVLHLPASKRPELTALTLIFDLELSDPRYGALEPACVLERLRECKVNGSGAGRGNKGLPSTLANLMFEAGAHDVTTIKQANKEVDAARTSKKKNKTRARPSEFRRLREK